MNLAASIALNNHYDCFKQVHVSEVRSLVEQDAVIIDVREKNKFANGHLLNTIHIPLSILRERMDEIPTDVPNYVPCHSSEQSYNAVMALPNSDFANIANSHYQVFACMNTTMLYR
ncbi:rhodanese-like domain-containing protein [Sporosarcina gallistercoris]|uniref:rhodanese-like domain-containing protein n=1 Tax=Sporosarcina gallistercoris TaxID=2762245 RepID=UPI003D2737F3